MPIRPALKMTKLLAALLLPLLLETESHPTRSIAALEAGLEKLEALVK